MPRLLVISLLNFMLLTDAARSEISLRGGRQKMFAEVSREAGIDFRNLPPVFDQKIRSVNALWANFISPVAVGDFNNDGLDDIFFASSRPRQMNALYRNRGGMTFENVTEGSGLEDLNDEDNLCAGALWFDYDNDGRLDLFVERFGHNLLFKNNGDGTFKNVTASSGLGLKRQNTLSAIAFDYDADGRLDLLVGGFFADDVDLFHLKTTKILPNDGHRADNGGTKTLYRNNGDGTFTDVTAKAGIKDTGFTTALGHGDYDSDGWQDFYIANDFGPDKLYRNNGNGTFSDLTEKALGTDGRKGMNVEFGDYNNDGQLDIYVTNITESWFRECNMLWLNWGDNIFVDVSEETGTCDTGWGWGAKFFDFDNDGRLDLYVADGFISGEREDYEADVERWQNGLPDAGSFDLSDANIWPPIGNKTFCGYERNRLFHNLGNHIFKEMGAEAGVDSLLDGRGVAVADFDNDGAMDILVTNSNQAPLLYHNLAGRKNNWIEIKLTGLKSNHNAIGARVRVVAGALSQIREVNCGNGYQAQSSFRLHFGLGQKKRVDVIEIKWPSGEVQRFRNQGTNRLLNIVEKNGR